MKKVLLISAVHGLSLGLKTLGAIIKERYEISYLYLDLLVTDKHPNFDKLVEFCQNFDYILISANSYNSDFTFSICDLLKKRIPKGKLIIGGQIAISEQKRCLEHVDYVSIWYAYNILELFDYLEGKRKTVPKNFIHKGKKFTGYSLPKTLDNIPPTDFSPNNNYFYFKRDIVSRPMYLEFVEIEAIHGCYFSCNFCSMSSENSLKKREYLPKLVKKSIENLIKEIKYALKVNPTIKRIAIQASNFFDYSTEELKQFVQRYNKSINKPLVFMADPRSKDYVKKVLISSELKCKVNIETGVQSGSDSVNMNYYNRPQNLNLLLKNHMTSLNLLKGKNNVKLFYSFISTFPYETTEDVIKTINLMLKLRKATIIVLQYTPIPNTPLGDEINKNQNKKNFYYEPNYETFRRNAFYYFYYNVIQFLYGRKLYFLLPHTFKRTLITDFLNKPIFSRFFYFLTTQYYKLRIQHSKTVKSINKIVNYN